ncbi:hypothetical protein [Methanobrevibacter sp.]|nr:hypothetical protein [Methanobrevibacter sp.]MDO5824290.1 hypothetical protein [Methanobrevibacter sp.]
MSCINGIDSDSWANIIGNSNQIRPDLLGKLAHEPILLEIQIK